MKKVIYSGDDSGFYCHSSFERFMLSEGAKQSLIKFCKDKITQIWMLKGVNVEYDNAWFREEAKTSVTLSHDDPNKLGSIEDIILEGAKKRP